ncbi:MAG: hypothetical protein RLY93_09640 [Sumerlaeia bacterium]
MKNAASQTVSVQRQAQILKQVRELEELFRIGITRDVFPHDIGIFSDEIKPPLENAAEYAYFKFALSTIGIEHDAMVAAHTENRDRCIRERCSHQLELHFHSLSDEKVLVISTPDGEVVEKHGGAYGYRPDLGVALRAVEIAWITRCKAGMDALRLVLMTDQTQVLDDDDHNELMEFSRGFAIDLRLFCVPKVKNASRWSSGGDLVFQANYAALIGKLKFIKRANALVDLKIGTCLQRISYCGVAQPREESSVQKEG